MRKTRLSQTPIGMIPASLNLTGLNHLPQCVCAKVPQNVQPFDKAANVVSISPSANMPDHRSLIHTSDSTHVHLHGRPGIFKHHHWPRRLVFAL